MTDDFIRELQADWLAQPVDKTLIVGRLKRGRWTPRVLFWLELLQGVAGLAGGVLFVWLAMDADVLALLFDGSIRARPESLLTLRSVFAVSGVVLLTTTPPLVWGALQARRGSLKWEDETPEGVLRVGVRRAVASLQANRVGRWHVWVLAAFVALLWGLVIVGFAPAYLVAFMTVTYAIIIAPLWLWLDLRRERVRRELETCLQLLQQYPGDRPDGGAESAS